MSATQPLLDIAGLTRVFDVDGNRQVIAVDHVDLHVDRSETLGIVGESGCGKSTLARLVLKRIKPSRGQIRLAGEEIAGLSERAFRPKRRLIQAVFQDPMSSLNPRLRVLDIVNEPLQALSLSRAEKRERARAALDTVSLPGDSLSRHPHEFSGGQRQRIAIARALIAEPSIIVCDEPTSALDVAVQAQVLNLLADIQATRGLSFLFISHNLAAVRQISQRIAVMYLGRIVETGPVSEIFRRPAHPYTGALLDAVPEPVLDQSFKKPLQGEVPSPFERPEGCAFASRCPKAQARCRATEPPLTLHGPKREVRCFYPD